MKASPDKVSDLEDAAYPSPKARYLYQRFTAELVNLPEETTMNPAVHLTNEKIATTLVAMVFAQILYLSTWMS